MARRPTRLDLGEEAVKVARGLIKKSRQYADLASFTANVHTSKELRGIGVEGKLDWIGRYIRGSVDKPWGLTLYLNVSHTPSVMDMASTILHEVGHGLWELLPEEARRLWKKEVTPGKWGVEEKFADDFMYLVRGDSFLMYNEQLFRLITRK